MNKGLVLVLMLGMATGGYVVGKNSPTSVEPVCIDDVENGNGIISFEPIEITKATRLSDGATMTIPVPVELVTTGVETVACPKE